MPAQDGYIRYQCCVCDKVEFVHKDDKVAGAKWKTHPYINMDDVRTDETVCDSCEQKYRLARSNADAAHNSVIHVDKEE